MSTTTESDRYAMGVSMKRKEDPRFIQGRGQYVDDFSLPGMLHLALVHSPYPHARIVKIDKTAALAVPGVVAVLTGEDLTAHGLAWIPTFHGYDKQMVLCVGKALYQYQEVAGVIASSREAAHDGAELVEVEYEPLDPVVDPFVSRTDATLVREDREAKTNHIYHWEVGKRADTDAALAAADVHINERIVFQRCHPAPLEPCGVIADMNSGTGRLTLIMTSQAPHAHRTVVSLVTGIPEDKIRIISPDIGGGFGNKVPVYAGYVVAAAASVVLGVPVKWIETRTENLTCTGFARDYHMDVEIGATKDGKVTALKVKTVADHGAFDAAADPTKYPAGLFGIVTGSYDLQAAHVETDGAYTNKAPGGVAYRCSFRVTEASYLIERLVESAALEMKMDPTEIRLKNFIQPEQFPYMSATGFEYDSGDYPRAMQVALDKLGYKELRKEQAEKRKKGELMGIGVASFTEVVGAGPGKHYDIAGLRMFDSAELRVHPTGKAILKLGVKSQGQGHETTFAQIVTEELGIPAADIEVQEGDTDNTPYGLGTYASRSTPVGGAATAMVSRKLRDKAKKIAAHLLEASEADIEFDHGKFFVRGSPSKSKTIQDVAFAAYTNLPDGLEAGLEGVTYYDPPNMTFPFGTYLVVVDIDRGTGQVKVRRMVAVDDCGVRINPMIVEGQIHGGLTEGFGIAFMELITFDEEGNCIGSNFTDYLLPTSWETPKFEMGETVTPSPHHPIGAKGVGESATVGSPAAFVNAVIDAVGHLGIRNIDMPVTSDKVWAALNEKGAAE
ncbi:MAG: aerobic carbon-monoxide dehydrogenase large subunit [Chloroflexota bacterium]|nr:aerobic carbon-monoxide dehydrogenase large subunit [Chloroflexota bacterium]